MNMNRVDMIQDILEKYEDHLASRRAYADEVSNYDGEVYVISFAGSPYILAIDLKNNLYVEHSQITETFVPLRKELIDKLHISDAEEYAKATFKFMKSDTFNWRVDYEDEVALVVELAYGHLLISLGAPDNRYVSAELDIETTLDSPDAKNLIMIYKELDALNYEATGEFEEVYDWMIWETML